MFVIINILYISGVGTNPREEIESYEYSNLNRLSHGAVFNLNTMSKKEKLDLPPMLPLDKEEFKNLSVEQKYQADRLARKQHQEIKNDRKTVDYLSARTNKLWDEGKIPESYKCYNETDLNFFPNHFFVWVFKNILDKIESGEIDLKKSELNENEIKKYLYREKPTAKLIFSNDIKMIYFVKVPEHKIFAKFRVPKQEATDSFKNEMPAQLLIRWMV